MQQICMLEKKLLTPFWLVVVITKVTFHWKSIIYYIFWTLSHQWFYQLLFSLDETAADTSACFPNSFYRCAHETRDAIVVTYANVCDVMHFLNYYWFASEFLYLSWRTWNPCYKVALKPVVNISNTSNTL